MKYSTTSLSAITLCVCMMLSHHVNGMNMRGTPFPFSNNNLNQMPMAGQPWNQQPNTNMQFGSNTWNTAATPMHPAPPSNRQPPEEITIGVTVDQMTENLYIHFPMEYNRGRMQWPRNSGAARHYAEMNWGNRNAIVACYKGNERYANAKKFYDNVDKVGNTYQKEELDSILFKRIANGQTANKEMGCLVFELPPNHENFRAFLGRTPTFASTKRLPSIVARIMDAVSYINGIGVVYNSIVADHIWVARNAMRDAYDIKLLHFDRSIIHEDYKELAAKPDFSPTSKLAQIYKSFIDDVRQTSKFIALLFSSYGKKLAEEFTPGPAITPEELKKHNEKRKALSDLITLMSDANSPPLMMGFKYTAQYDLISGNQD